MRKLVIAEKPSVARDIARVKEEKVIYIMMTILSAGQ